MSITKQEGIQRVYNRVPRMKENPAQINSQILQAFFDYEKEFGTRINKDAFVLWGKERTHIKTFKENFDKMNNLSEKSNAKVFAVKSDGELVLWEPVADFIRKTWQQK